MLPFVSTIGCVAVALPGLATAQATGGDDSYALEEIIVTAEKIESTAQETSRAISVIDTAELTEIGAVTLQDALLNVPGFSYTGGAFGQAGMRSVTLGNTDTNQMASIVAVNVDGAAAFGGARGGSASGIESALFDVDRVEVIRGPSGTMVGQNALAGSVNIVTRKPTLQEWNFNGALGVGNYGSQTLSLGGNIPVGDTFALRLAYNQNERDAYTQQTLADHSQTVDGSDYEDIKQARLRALWQPTDKFDIVLTYNYTEEASNARINGNINNSDPWLSEAPPFVTELSNPTRQPPAKISNYTAEITWDTDYGTLYALPTYTEQENPDNRPDFCFGDNPPPGGPCQLPQKEKRKGYEVRWNGTLFDDKFDYMVGYLNDEQTINGGFASGGDISIDNLNTFVLSPNLYTILDIYQSENPGITAAYIDGARTFPPRNTKSFYANFTWHITDMLRLSFGARSAKDSTGGSYYAAGYGLGIPEGGLDALEWVYTAEDGGLPQGTIVTGIPDPVTYPDTNNGDWTINTPQADLVAFLDTPFQYKGETTPTNYSAGVEWDWTDSNMLYFNYNTGYQPGGVEAFLVPIYMYPAQEIDAFALGSKNRFADNRVEINVEGYMYDYKNWHGNSDFTSDLVYEAQDGVTYVQPFLTQWADGQDRNAEVPYPTDYNPAGKTYRSVVKSMKHYGLEADIRALITPKDSITANVAIRNHKFTDDFIDENGYNLKGYRLGNSPALTMRLSYSHDFQVFSGVLAPRLDVKYVSDEFINNSFSSPFDGQLHLLDNTIPAHAKWDAYLSYRADSGVYSVNAYMRNVENTAQVTQQFFPGGGPQWISEPRTYGITFNYNYE